MTIVSSDSETAFYYDAHQWLVGVVTLMGTEGEGGTQTASTYASTRRSSWRVVPDDPRKRPFAHRQMAMSHW